MDIVDFATADAFDWVEIGKDDVVENCECYLPDLALESLADDVVQNLFFERKKVENSFYKIRYFLNLNIRNLTECLIAVLTLNFLKVTKVLLGPDLVELEAVPDYYFELDEDLFENKPHFESLNKILQNKISEICCDSWDYSHKIMISKNIA